MTPYDTNAVRMLIDSVLFLHGWCLDEPEERQTIAAAIKEVLVEYLGSQMPASDQQQ